DRAEVKEPAPGLAPRRKRHRALVAELVVRRGLPPDPRKRRLDRERNEDPPAPRRLAAARAERGVPEAVEKDPIGPNERRTRILRMGAIGADIRRPSRLERPFRRFPCLRLGEVRAKDARGRDQEKRGKTKNGHVFPLVSVGRRSRARL